MKKYIALIAIIIFAGIGLGEVKANPSFWTFGNQTAATTSPTYMIPGVATSTVVLDSMSGGTYATDEATVVTQIAATTTTNSTEPIIRFRIEGSQDGIDWYGQASYLNTTGTTTVLSAINGEYQINFASSTANLGASATTTRMNESFTVKTPLRYTRVVTYAALNGGTANVWVQIIGRKQYK